ncbi:hypothetical protein [Novosphingobium sp. Rr 2-17]|uniref:hypothetical protein n=1 Tax=Novosphingobium sp. Rr 2-17 TaxID=555793 RepID=UPI0012F6EE07|nr:hypothetical protein [Novosphingobium sp. Rr 2-17]
MALADREFSMSLKDAKALCEVIARGIAESDKREFQRTRAEEARTLGKRRKRETPKTRHSPSGGYWPRGRDEGRRDLCSGTLKF